MRRREASSLTPPLPQPKQDALKRLGFGVLNKVALFFDKPFWSHQTDFFGRVVPNPKHRGRFFLFFNLEPASALPSSSPSPRVRRRARAAGGRVGLKQAVDALKSMFGAKAVPDPTRTVVTRWGNDKFARGSYSYVHVGASGQDYATLGEPIGERMYAGEHTIMEHPATVVGAYLSRLAHVRRGRCMRSRRRRLPAAGEDESGGGACDDRRRGARRNTMPTIFVRAPRRAGTRRRVRRCGSRRRSSAEEGVRPRPRSSSWMSVAARHHAPRRRRASEGQEGEGGGTEARWRLVAQKAAAHPLGRFRRARESGRTPRGDGRRIATRDIRDSRMKARAEHPCIFALWRGRSEGVQRERRKEEWASGCNNKAGVAARLTGMRQGRRGLLEWAERAIIR